MIPTLIIIAITVLISAQAFNNSEMFHKGMFNAYQVHHNKQWYRFFSHGFLHADWNHLLFNMFTLFFFGRNLFQYYSAIFGDLALLAFVGMYITSIAASSVVSYFKHKDNVYYNAVGASGAVSAVLFACILFSPWSSIYIYFIKIPGVIYGIIYLIYSAYMSKRGGDNIGHDAHLWGAVYGILFTIALKPGVALYFIENLLNKG